MSIVVAPRAMPYLDYTLMNIGSRKSTDQAMDRLDTIAGVSFFGFMAYVLSGTHVVMAIICVFFAAMMPHIVKSTHRTKDELFGSHRDEDE